jgi:ABC-type antimicrobial peptide transport system permease subunit
MSGGGLELSYPSVLIAGLIIVTLVISIVGSLLALRKITKLEPVEIFRM